MNTITENTLLKQGNKIYQPIEVGGIIYWYENRQIPNAGYVKSVCLGEIASNKEHGVKPGDKQYITPFVNNVGECYGCRKIVAQSQSKLAKLEGIPVIDLSKSNRTIGAIILAKELLKKENYHENSDVILYLDLAIKDIRQMYTVEDIEKTIELARKNFDGEGCSIDVMSVTEIIKQVNSISVIEVDEQFNILGYEK